MPDGWTEATLGDVAAISIGRTPPRKEARYWTEDLTRPFCTIADMVGPSVMPTREGVTEAAEVEGKAKRVPAGSLLMSFKLTIGRVGIAGMDVFPNEAIAWLEPNAKALDKRFLALWLETTDVASGAGRAVKGNTLNSDSLRAIPVAFPPPAEQRRIVDLIGAVDEALGGNNRVGAAASAAYVAMLRDMYGSMLADCEARPLGEVATTRLGKMLDSKRLTGEAFPYLANVNVRWDAVEMDGLKTVPLTEREREELSLRADDALVCEGGEAGRTAVLSHDLHGIYFQKAIHRVRCGPRLRPRFFMHFMRYAAGNGLLADYLSELTIQHLTGEKLRLIPVPLPSLKQQESIVALLDALLDLSMAAAHGASAAGSMRTALLTQLLSGDRQVPPSYDRFLDNAA